MKSTFLVLVILFCVSTTGWSKTDPGPWCGTKGTALTEYSIKMHERHQKERDTDKIVTQNINEDIGEIAVIEGSANTLVQPNPFDLVGRKITFIRNANGNYTMKVGKGKVSGAQGNAINLTDDDSEEVQFTSGFRFPFFGKTHEKAFINSDGNLTFEESDFASTDRSVFRALAGPPRIFPFFADLNPEEAGEVRISQTSTRFRVTWNEVPEFGKPGSSNTIQVDLFKSGNIVIVMGKAITTQEAVTGISPGNSNPGVAKFVDYSKTASLAKINDAVAERFATNRSLDLLALVQEFHQSHPKIFDFVVIFTDLSYIRTIAPGAFAFFLPIENSVKGIGRDLFDFSQFYGSPKLQGLLMMDAVGKYPADPDEDFLGTNSTIEIMGQENGHRWMSFPRARIGGTESDELLGRDLSHWNFFFDSDASVMEGNDIADNGNGTFTTVAATETFSKLDRYLMGFLPASKVPPFFFVRTGALGRGDPPQVGISFAGERVNVTVQDIIAAEGPRVPNSVKSQKVFREAFIFFVTPGQGGPKPADIEKVDLIRRKWSAFFRNATKKGVIKTTLP